MRKLAMWAAFGTLAVGLAFTLGSREGKHAGEETAKRLQLVWPDFMDKPDMDRAVLAGFAMTCDLHKRPTERAEVLACLREAANDPNATRPKGFSQDQAASKLEQLIEQSQDQLSESGSRLI